MKFDCKEISIDDEEVGCAVTFSENTNQGIYVKEQTVDEIMNSIEKYIMLQRTYSEDEFEKDYYYFESSDFEKSGELNNFEINLSRTKFTLTFENEVYEIQINSDNHTFDKLRIVLKKIAHKKGEIIFLD